MLDTNALAPECNTETALVPTKFKNRLNDLTGKEWVQGSKSVWRKGDHFSDLAEYDIEEALGTGCLLSKAPPRDALKKNHPATFSEGDASRLIRYFTRQNERVLDPFMGVASTGIACLTEERHFTGFELYDEWYDIAHKRMEVARGLYNAQLDIDLKQGDALDLLKRQKSGSTDFVLTSPPYWGILNKIDHKAKQERIANGLATNYGNHNDDLAEISTYQGFLKILKQHIKQYFRVLRESKYLAMIVCDFRHGNKYYMFHSDISDLMESVGFTTQGLIALIQDNKRLYPYGYPTTYVPSISNQFIVIGRKIK